jgi:uncharacterized protein with ParB-like and HNH nuclease domain
VTRGNRHPLIPAEITVDFYKKEWYSVTKLRNKIMETSTTIRKMLAGNKIIVPTYQRAYSWDTPEPKSERKTHTDVFLSDLEEYCQSKSASPYYFGHFLFEEESNSTYEVIDGQQRLTTIVIFLSAVFYTIIKVKNRNLSEEEQNIYEDIIKRRSEIRFSTVKYDNTLFIDYVIEQTQIDKNGLETDSAKRIVNAFDYFKNKLKNKDEEYLKKILFAISNASCTTHIVRKELEAIQMFIFQNSRGKKPSNLEIVKAQFMYNVHLYGGKDTNILIEDLKNRFEKIYKSISKIEYRIDEDDVLNISQKIYYDSLWEDNVLDKINKELSGKKSIDFIINFTRTLAKTFEKLSLFFTVDERTHFHIHSLTVLGRINIILPFIVKAYNFGLNIDDIDLLAKSFESIILRQRLIGTRADLTSRISDLYVNFSEHNKNIENILKHIDKLKKTSDWWSAYWNNKQLKAALQGSINHDTAKYLLWKYENSLEKGKKGYSPKRYDAIKKPELEHIAPQKEPKEKNHGYDKYDDEFCDQYIDCLGNYLLLSKSHNASIHNDPFKNKLKDYTFLAQQRKIKDYVDQKNPKWTKKEILSRKEDIINFVLLEF